MSETLSLVRPDLRDMQAYASAASDRDMLRLHANESPYDSGKSLNRYPEPQPDKLIKRLATLYAVDPANVLATRGSDDAIDILLRCFCRAGLDSILVCPPTFGMYAIAARLQNASLIEVPLDKNQDFAIDASAVAEACTATTRLVFLCSPNNPTGNLVPSATVAKLCAALAATTLVVVDEAYIEFAGAESCVGLIDQLPNLVVLRTLSKAHALAGARCGALIAAAELVEAIRPAMPPYALPTLTIDAALGALAPDKLQQTLQHIAMIRDARQQLKRDLDRLPIVRKTWPSEGNFILTEVMNSGAVLNVCRERGILIRDMGAQAGLDQHIRITVGTAEQNQRLLKTLESLT